MAITERHTTASVLTLVRGRQAHLDALIAALARQSCLTIELVIAYMQPEPPVIAAALPFPVTLVYVPGDKMPLAAARNAAALQARSDRLIFLDVDCIPSPGLVENFIQQLELSGRCLLGEVRYLPGTLSKNEIDSAAFGELVASARQHPARPCLPPDKGWIAERETRALWGLSFAMTKQQYKTSGGMDEAYVGYGGEETDFAEQLAANGIKLGWCTNAMALHQYHAVYSPPLDRFEDIIRNAVRFYDKWGSWCMEYWLNYFVVYGLIEWAPDAHGVRILRIPLPTEVRACRQTPEVAFA